MEAALRFLFYIAAGLSLIAGAAGWAWSGSPWIGLAVGAAVFLGGLAYVRWGF